MKRQSLVSNRTNLLAGLLVVIALCFTARLFYLQVIRHSYYNNLAVNEQQKQFNFPATRGLIYFKDGDKPIPTVLNEQVYTLYADQTLVKNNKEVAKDLHEVLPKVKQADLLKQLKIKHNKPEQYVVLDKQLSKKQADKILSKKLAGINLTPVPQRVYPEGKLGSQLLGFVNSSGDGQYGVEGALNNKLKGKPGRLKAITDVNGVPLAFDQNNVALQPKNGKSVVLTVDRNVQSAAERILAQGLENASATKGSMIVVDPNTGAILAMANAPTYNPAKYYDAKTAEVYQNRTVSAPYEAGSVMKILTMATGLDTNVIQPNSTYYNAGVVRVSDFNINNAPGDEIYDGTRNMREILQYSLNTGAVWILQQMGHGNINNKAKQTLYNYFTQRFGFGKTTGIKEADEQPGYVSLPDKSSQVRYANMTFGQGLTVTMLQYTTAYSSIINGGKYHQPYIVDGYMNADNKEVNKTSPKVVRQTVSPKVAKETTDLMVRARALVPYLHASDPAGYVVGGKSGTSQKVDEATGKYSDTQTVSSYVGFTGNPKPKYVIMVRVDNSTLHNATGSTAANPIFATMNKWMINYEGLEPQR